MAAETPTFKLVLVGDGGTGKVIKPPRTAVHVLLAAVVGGSISLAELPRCVVRGIVLTRNFLPDHLRQAPCDG